MGKHSLHLFAFLILLHVLASVFQATLLLFAGASSVQRVAFVPWLIASFAVLSINMIAWLIYGVVRKYAFVSISVFLMQCAVTYSFVIYLHNIRSGELATQQSSVQYASSAAMVLFSCALILSPAGRVRLLRITGIVGVIISVLFLSLYVYFLQEPSFHIVLLLTSTYQVLTFIFALLPVLPAIHFLHEARSAQNVRHTPSALIAGWCLAVALTLSLCFAGVNLVRDQSRAAVYISSIPDYAKKSAEPFESRFFVSGDGDTLHYRFFRPANIQVGRLYPLVVSLHGGGGHGSDNVMQMNDAEFALKLATPENRLKYPAFIFVPQCPPGSTWGQLPFGASAEDLVFSAIEQLQKNFPIDAGRRYVVGLSMGGYGTWNFIIRKPEMFAAAIPVCGGADHTYAHTIRDIAVWSFHGHNDGSVPVRYSRDMINAIKKAGGHPRYTEFPDEGHNIGFRVLETPGLLDWLFSQRKSQSEHEQQF